MLRRGCDNDDDHDDDDNHDDEDEDNDYGADDEFAKMPEEAMLGSGVIMSFLENQIFMVLLWVVLLSSSSVERVLDN